MAKANRTGRSKGASAHIRLHHWMLDSAACLALSGDAFKVLLYVWRRHNGKNNGNLPYSVRDAAKIGLHRNTAAKALAELVCRGFLSVTRESAFNMKSRSGARLWRITAEPCGDDLPTKDFMRWQPRPVSPCTRTKAGRNKDSTVPPEGLISPSPGTPPPENAKKLRAKSLPRDLGAQKQPSVSPSPGTLYIYQGGGDGAGAPAETGSAAPPRAGQPAGEAGSDGSGKTVGNTSEEVGP